MKRIGFTGGIGSGKTTAARLFSEMYQIPIINADELSKQTSQRTDVINKIKNIFGDSCIDDNRIERAKLAQIVFHDAEKLKRLNAVIHPIVIEEYKNRCFKLQQEGKKYVIFDCPLLIEENMQDSVDVTVLIYADKKLRFDRIMERNGFTYEEILRRNDAQIDLDEKIALSNIVIYNNGSVDELKTALKYLYKEVIIL